MRDSLIGLMRMSKGHLQLIALTLSFFFFSWWVVVRHVGFVVGASSNHNERHNY